MGLLNLLSVVKVDRQHFLEQVIHYGPGGSQDSDHAGMAKDAAEVVGKTFTAPDGKVWTIVAGNVLTATVRTPISRWRAWCLKRRWAIDPRSQRTGLEIL